MELKEKSKVVEIAGTAHNLMNEESTSNSHQKLQEVIKTSGYIPSILNS